MDNVSTPELTPEQIKAVQEVYGIVSATSFSDEDIALAKTMFDTPEKFVLLRRIFQVLNQGERGLLIPHEFANVSGSTFEQLGIEVAIQKRADEIVRSSLVSFYCILRDSIREDLKVKLEAENQEQFEEKQKEEAKEEEHADANKQFGPNL
jgi:hypothetical protein